MFVEQALASPGSANKLNGHFFRNSKSWMASKSLYWFKCYGNFAEWVDFAYCLLSQTPVLKGLRKYMRRTTWLSKKLCSLYELLTTHIVPFVKFHRIGGALPETFPNVKYEYAPEEVGGDRKCFDSRIRKWGLVQILHVNSSRALTLSSLTVFCCP